MGLGITLFLTAVFYTPLLDVPAFLAREFNTTPMYVYGNFAGAIMIAVASFLMVLGFVVIKKQITAQSNWYLCLTVPEILAESCILGWWLMVSGFVLPIPTSTWSLQSALWLENMLGISGSIAFPLVVAGICLYFKHHLKNAGGKWMGEKTIFR